MRQIGNLIFLVFAAGVVIASVENGDLKPMGIVDTGMKGLASAWSSFTSSAERSD